MKKSLLHSLAFGISILPLMPLMAVAQDTQAQPAAPAEQKGSTQEAQDTKAPATTTVTVTADKPVNRIDRQVYDAKSDIANQTGTAADALNKVPSVNVDTEGNVTLRGQSGVKVMIDGRSSVMMSGDNRAATIQSMSASDIESIEVINNPSAAFGSEGSGGIINIVMRKNRKPGKSATFIASVGAKDRYNATLSGSYNSGKYTVSGGVSLRKDGRKFTGTTDREIKDGLGDTRRSEIESSGFGRRDSLSVNFGFDYNLNDNDTLGIGLAQSQRAGDSTSFSRTISKDVVGTVYEDYSRNQTGENPRDDGQIKIRFDHKGDENAETLKFDATYAASNGRSDQVYTNIYTVGGLGADAKNRQISLNDQETATFNGDYNRNLAGGQVGLGFQVDNTRNLYDNAYYGINSSGVQTLDPQFTNRFEIEQWQQAAYVTYQHPLSEAWILMGGLRVENTHHSYHQVTTAILGSHEYTGYYPSLFLAYTLSEKSKLRFSYSKRSQQPRDSERNPFLTYGDAQNVSSGNVDLDPQITHAFELGYEYGQKGLNASVRGYYRQNTDVIVDYSYFIAPDLLLTTKQNGGESQSGGVEFSLTGMLTPKLKASINGNINYTELTATYGSLSSVDCAVSLSGRASFDYTLGANDRLQFMAGMMGKQLTGQGYREPTLFTNISYRHQVTPKLSLVATVNDPFETMKFKTVTQTAFVNTTSERSMGGRVFYIGLTYLFGGATAESAEQLGPRMGPGMRGMGQGGPM